MSFQSDVLSPEDQKFLYDEVAGVPLQLFDDEPTILLTDFPKNEEILKIPKPVTTVLSNEEYEGPFNFEVDIIPNGSKNGWFFSPTLNKVYMDIKAPFPIDFKVKQRPLHPLFIRVTPMYSSPQYAQECVSRCVNHEYAEATTSPNIMAHIRPHIIRCQNQSAFYIGDKTNNERLSIIIPLSFPQMGTNSIREMFEFTCKNSCPVPGMNRRSIEVIFTLEDSESQIYGRKTLNVRICSCPKRDKEKEEADDSGKTQPPKGKKRKLDKSAKKIVSNNQDLREFTIQIPIAGKHNIGHVLKYCHDLMAGEVARHSGNGVETTAPYTNVLSKISTMIKDLNE
ncbi:cellular tumor antigen p53 isoform X1 [Diabrotica undecimpunctata]|uniref:cellular tumor antigen p53 isoform X1 n=1 Tax=Diabrotica undecimpunctata TaxID=50387 RepID=UPI003B6402D2